MESELNFLSTLKQHANSARHRYCVALCGEVSWATVLIQQWHRREQIQTSRVIWLGDTDLETNNYLSLPVNKGNQILGEESTGLVYDFSCGINANSLSAAAGTIVAGGICFLILSREDYFSQSYFFTWMRSVSSSLILLEQGSDLPRLPSFTKQGDSFPDFHYGCLSAEQKSAVDMIIKVVTGHRKRPLVLTADRGRGKTSALGIALSELTQHRQLAVLVTAPSKRAVDALYKHLSLAKNGSTVTFISPDELLLQRPKCDLLIVDEAAAIPLTMLDTLLEHYHRTVFSTTIHGYEGTGRGFTLKFDPILNAKTPGWNSIAIHQPIRWNPGDPLESWLFDCFLFGAELGDIDTLSFSEALREIEYSAIDKSALVNNQTLFKQLFALLVNAHYQTSPNDMIQLLNDSTLDLFVGIYDQQIVSCSIISNEGDLESELINGVMSGQRRPVGHLLPVSVALHLNQPEAARQRCARIMRIAVHPSVQNKKVGSGFISFLHNHYQSVGVDYLGTSFGATSDLIHFWYQNDFKAVRFGIRRDKASGTHSLMVVRAISTQAESWLCNAINTFDFCLPQQLVEQFSPVEPAIILSLLHQSTGYPRLPSEQRFLIDGFVSQALGYDSVVPALQVELLHHLSTQNSLLSDEVTLFAIEKILQRKTWKDLIPKYGIIGRKQAEQILSRYFYHNLHCKSEG
ncbi:GNAT family N-acetyltransferase [Aliivibrio kagoshimensis]|uniref:GNAT family N-acetyltransferase n=1 Tax=Aliivibrio kagoshimensis TaxID=2910230 RepID=UPI003D0E9174